jgi:hypothetical protein
VCLALAMQRALCDAIGDVAIRWRYRDFGTNLLAGLDTSVLTAVHCEHAYFGS